jgi:hypothetical protein
MNPVGIPVFYGALSIDTAIAEVRPSVGSRVVVGTFHVTRKIRLLDLPRLGDHWLGSIFDSGYADALSRQKFLETFHWMISRPVQPSDEPLEYIPTQIVAEYVANVLKFDGILFASAQRGNSESPYGSNVEDEFMNVVLFGDAAVVDRPRSKEQPTERAVDTWDPDPRTARQNPPGLAFQVDSAKPFLMKGVKYDYSEDRRVPIERLYPAPLGLPF